MSGRAFAARLLPAAGLLVAVFALSRTVDLRVTLALLATVDGGSLAAAFGLLAVLVALATLKVRAVWASAGMVRSFRRIGAAILSSATLNLFVPGRGGDLFRAVVLSDDRQQVLPAVGAVALERLLDLGTLGLLGLVLGALTANWTTAGLSAAVLVALAGALGGAALGVRLPGLERRLAPVRQVFGTVALHPKRLAGAALLSGVAWWGNLVLMLVCLRAFDVDLPAQEIFAVAPLAILTAIVPVSISGLGTRDLVLVSLLGAPGERVAAGALLYGVVQSIALPLLGSLVLGREGLASYRRLVHDRSLP